MNRLGHIALVIDPAHVRVVHLELAQRLCGLAERVTITPGRPQCPLPASVDLLFELERMIHRFRPRLTQPVDFRTLALPETGPEETPDLIVDLCGCESASGGRTIHLLFDGASGEAALLGALVAGTMPVVEVVQADTRVRLASGIPCADNATSIFEAFECVLARVIPLLIRGIATDRQSESPAIWASRPTLRTRSILAVEAKAIAHAIVRHLYALCFYTPHWRVCWRSVVGQQDLWSARTLSNTDWAIVPDPGFRFYADPFPFQHRGRTYLFVEDLDHRQNKGVISVIPFDSNGPSRPARIVLEEPWHLSYPFLLEHAGEIWMIPESSANGTVSLYRAARFPDRWVREATLLSGIEASDATVVRQNGLFWMFAATRDGAGSWSDTMSIFFAQDLLGPWSAHPRNPILIDQTAARPAGAMVIRDGRLWRPVQDCAQGYGTGIGLAEITRLDVEGFDQTIHAVLRPQAGWPGRRLHTLNRAGPIECIDGTAYSPRNRIVARRFELWSGRRNMQWASAS
jgi:hypothetical protein